MPKPYYLSIPHAAGGEGERVADALNAKRVNPIDAAVKEFEREFADYLGASHVASVSSGTAAMHMALKAAGVGPGDSVICSTLTFAASANPIVYLGAQPVFVDCDKTMTIDPEALRRAIAQVDAKAVITVDIYGNSTDYGAVRAETGDLPIIADAAEALGSRYRGVQCGLLGDFGVYSFNTNKLITTGGGGMVVSADEAAIDKIAFWSRQSKDPDFNYLHSELGYNYRMNAVGAAVGLAQLEEIEQRLERKRDIQAWYKEEFADTSIEVLAANDDCISACWLTVARFARESGARGTQEISRELAALGIETRPAWRPLHAQPFFEGAPIYSASDGRPLSEVLAEECLCLPSDITMERDGVVEVAQAVRVAASR